MDKLREHEQKTFRWALGLSLAFPFGVLMIIFGFINGGWMIAMAITGIVLCVAGFYVMPLLWIRRGTLRGYLRCIDQIENDGIRSVRLLAEVRGEQYKTTLQTLREMTEKGYLTNYVILDGERIVTTRDRALMQAMGAARSGTLNRVKCPSCGAALDLAFSTDICPYCHTAINAPATTGEVFDE